MANVDTIKRDLVKTIDAMKKNIKFYLAAKKSGDQNKLEKHKKIALDLQGKKNKLEKDLDDAIVGIHADAELEIEEQILRKELRKVIKEIIKEL